MTFGERLTQLRKENGYATRNEFADRLGIPSTTLRNYETDAREPGHTFLKQISELFNVSVDYLLCLTDDKEVLNPFRLRTSEQKLIENYRLLDSDGQEVVNYILVREVKNAEDRKATEKRLLKYAELLSKSRVSFVAEKSAEYSAVKAANARTDIDHTPEGKAHDDAIMDDDSEWE